MTHNPPVFEVLPRDLSSYRQGNVGVDYVHRFESGKPGPHVLINALTHGNEICGMVAATHLLDTGIRPLVGTLTISFANVAAYESFDPARPFESRQLVHNLNRVWRPPVHLVMPSGLGSGTPLIQHGRHGQDDGHGVALVVECGQHFRQSAADVATLAALDFLAHFGLIERTGQPAETLVPRRFELLETCMVRTADFRFVRPLVGFEVFDQSDLIATDGPHDIRAPCDGCTIFMPTREPIVGREAVYLTRPLG